VNDVARFAVSEEALAGDESVHGTGTDRLGRSGVAFVDVVQVGVDVAHAAVRGLLVREQCPNRGPGSVGAHEQVGGGGRSVRERNFIAAFFGRRSGYKLLAPLHGPGG
jgi:hypothetical protein